MTETSGEGMYSASWSVRCWRRSIGVNPDACTSLTSGSDSFPSGRTGTVRLRSGQFFHTVMSRTSSGPIRYSFVISTALVLRTTGATRAAGDTAGAGAAASGPDAAGADAAGAGEGSAVVAAGVEAGGVADAGATVASACGGVGDCTFCACATHATHITRQRRTGRRTFIEKPLSRVRPDRPAL